MRLRRLRTVLPVKSLRLYHESWLGDEPESALVTSTAGDGLPVALGDTTRRLTGKETRRYV